MKSRKAERIKQKNKMRKRIRFIILLLIITIIIYTIIEIIKENKIEFKEEVATQEVEVTPIQVIIEEELPKEKVEIPETYLDYPVTAKIIIPKINLETNVLRDFSKETLDKCLVKFWGPNPNEIGNFCIAGHNYEKENMFSDLKELEVGEEFYLLDNKNGKYTYVISDIYKVNYKNLEPINQNTNGKRVVTLITCTNYSNNERLIVRGIEKE